MRRSDESTKNTFSQNQPGTRKPLEDMDIIDDFLAGEIFSGPDAVRFSEILLSLVMGREVKVSNIQSQVVLHGEEQKNRSIRLDAMVIEEAPGTPGSVILYNTEMEQFYFRRKKEQTLSLPRRVRYHQSLMDAAQSKSGALFSELPDIVNIFIMDYDPFGMGSMYYEVQNRFITHEALDYNDGLRKIFLFTNGAVPDGSGLKELQAVLRYIQNSEQKNIVDDLTREIDTFVRRLKDNAEVRKHYMWAHEREQILIQDAQDEIRAEKDKVIAEKDSVIAKKDNVIAEKNSALSEMSNVVAQQNNALAEKNSVITQKDNTIAEKDSALAEKDSIIAQLQSRILKLEGENT